MNDGSLLALNLAEARDGLARKVFSARELAAAYNDAIAGAKPLNAYITPTPERALEMADAADQRLTRGEALPLDGIPVAVKDLFCTKDILTTAGSHILDWVEQLNEFDTTGVPPMASAAAASLPMRDDAMTDGGCRDTIIGNAPRAARGFFTVPKVVE